MANDRKSTSLETFYGEHNTDRPFADDRLCLVADLVKKKNPGRILDLACGRGALLELLRRELPAAELVGVDLSTSSVTDAQAKGLNVYPGNIADGLSIEDHSFDMVIFGEIIEHLVDPDAALSEISRILKVGGSLVLTTPNLASWFNRLFLLFGIQPIFTETSLHANLGRRFKALGQWRPAQGHLKIFTRNALSEMLEAHGYTIEWFGGAPFHQDSPAMGLDRLLSRFPALASNFVVLACSSGRVTPNYPKLPAWDAGIEP